MATGRLMDYLGVGNLADRPISIDEYVGTLATYYAADTGQLFFWTGSVWVEFEGGGGGAVWGAITGNLVDQTDLVSVLDDIDLALGSKLESVQAGTNVTIDNTDPLNPIINASGGGGGYGAALFVPNNVSTSVTSSSAFATKGIIHQAQEDLTVGRAVFTIRTPTAGKVYQPYFFRINSSGLVSARKVLDTYTTLGTNLDENISVSVNEAVVKGEYYVFAIRDTSEAATNFAFPLRTFSSTTQGNYPVLVWKDTRMLSVNPNVGDTFDVSLSTITFAVNSLIAVPFS